MLRTTGITCVSLLSDLHRFAQNLIFQGSEVKRVLQIPNPLFELADCAGDVVVRWNGDRDFSKLTHVQPKNQRKRKKHAPVLITNTDISAEPGCAMLPHLEGFHKGLHAAVNGIHRPRSHIFTRVRVILAPQIRHVRGARAVPEKRRLSIAAESNALGVGTHELSAYLPDWGRNLAASIPVRACAYCQSERRLRDLKARHVRHNPTGQRAAMPIRFCCSSNPRSSAGSPSCLLHEIASWLR